MEGSLYGEIVLKAICLSQDKDTVEYGVELFVSVPDIRVYFITETQRLMEVYLPALSAPTLNSESKLHF